MKLKIPVITAAIISCALSFTSFANDEAVRDEVVNVRKENRPYSAASGQVIKINFNDYKPKASQNSKVESKYMNFPNQRMGMNKIAEGGKLVSHNHDTDQSGYIIKGETKLIYGPKNTSLTLKAGDSFFIPRLVQHEMIAITDVEMITFNPGTVANENAMFKH